MVWSHGSCCGLICWHFDISEISPTTPTYKLKTSTATFLSGNNVPLTRSDPQTSLSTAITGTFSSENWHKFESRISPDISAHKTETVEQLQEICQNVSVEILIWLDFILWLIQVEVCPLRVMETLNYYHSKTQERGEILHLVVKWVITHKGLTGIRRYISFMCDLSLPTE